MAYRGDHRLTWSIQHGAAGEYADRVMDDLADACARICAAHLPEASGYEVQRTRLTGPLDGVSLTVTRANFRAVVSLQRFRRLTRGAEAGHAPIKLRLVAAAQHVDAPDEAVTNEVAVARWGMGSCAAFTLGAGAVGLKVAGMLTAWAYALLLVPTLIACRVSMSFWVAGRLRQPALPTGPALAQRDARAKAQNRDMVRWHEAMRDLAAQHAVIVERFALRPFRGLSAGPTALSPSMLDSDESITAAVPSVV